MCGVLLLLLGPKPPPAEPLTAGEQQSLMQVVCEWLHSGRGMSNKEKPVEADGLPDRKVEVKATLLSFKQNESRAMRVANSHGSLAILWRQLRTF